MLEGGGTIGDNVHISRNLTIYSCSHNYEGNLIPYDGGLIRKPVVIEDNVWIGMNVSIVPGVTVGEGSILGMSAVVVKDVPPFAIVGGNPASIIGSRSEERYKKLCVNGAFSGVGGRPLV